MYAGHSITLVQNEAVAVYNVSSHHNGDNHLPLMIITKLQLFNNNAAMNKKYIDWAISVGTAGLREVPLSLPPPVWRKDFWTFLSLKQSAISHLHSVLLSLVLCVLKLQATRWLATLSPLHLAICYLNVINKKCLLYLNLIHIQRKFLFYSI